MLASLGVMERDLQPPDTLVFFLDNHMPAEISRSNQSSVAQFETEVIKELAEGLESAG